MSPISPKAAPKTKVVKAKAEAKKAPKEWSGMEHKLYFLWLHLQMKDGNKPNHAAVATKLNITTNAAFKRFTQIKKHMEQIEESMAPPEPGEKKKYTLDFNQDPISKVFEELDTVFSQSSVLR